MLSENQTEEKALTFITEIIEEIDVLLSVSSEELSSAEHSASLRKLRRSYYFLVFFLLFSIYFCNFFFNLFFILFVTFYFRFFSYVPYSSLLFIFISYDVISFIYSSVYFFLIYFSLLVCRLSLHQSYYLIGEWTFSTIQQSTRASKY